MISPLSSFIDPGSEVFERAEDHGYHLFYHTLEEHRQALVLPSWKYMLSYETDWLSRDEIVDATYEAALGFNGIKADYGLISAQAAAQVESRIRQSLSLIQKIDRLVAEQGLDFQGEPPLKYEIKELSLAATCQKKELEWPARSFFRSMPRMLYNFCRRS